MFSVKPRPPAHLPPEVILAGEVKSGGTQVSLKNGKALRLMDAVVAAGGFSEFADRRNVKLRRITRDYKHEVLVLDLSAPNKDHLSNPVLQNRDFIVVPMDKEKEAKFLKAVRFNAGDVMRIEIKDPTGKCVPIHVPAVVDAGGGVTIPKLADPVPASGCSIVELEKRIGEAWSQTRTFDNPAVSLVIWGEHHRPLPSVTVRGEVNDGKRMPLREGTRIMEAVSLAGGFTSVANLAAVRLVRGMTEETWNISRKASYEPQLKSGDVIIVDRK